MWVGFEFVVGCVRPARLESRPSVRNGIVERVTQTVASDEGAVLEVFKCRAGEREARIRHDLDTVNPQPHAL